jgi:hypothetical protein
MQREVHDAISELFPKTEFDIEWGSEGRAPEFPEPIGAPETFKCAVSIMHLENSHDVLLQKLSEFKAQDNNPEGYYSFFTGEPRLDFNPGDGVERIKAVIYYVG